MSYVFVSSDQPHITILEETIQFSLNYDRVAVSCWNYTTEYRLKILDNRQANRKYKKTERIKQIKRAARKSRQCHTAHGGAVQSGQSTFAHAEPIRFSLKFLVSFFSFSLALPCLWLGIVIRISKWTCALGFSVRSLCWLVLTELSTISRFGKPVT